MAENLKLYYQEQLARYQTLRSEAAVEAALINEELALARTDHAALVTTYGEQERTVAATRKAMAVGGLMPADVEALAVVLRQLLIDQRSARVALLTVADQMAVLERSRALVAERMELLDSRLNEIDGDLALAIEQAEQHAEWAQRVSDGLVADLQAQTAALLAIAAGGALDPEPEADAVTMSEATARVNADIPEVLRDHARPRGAYMVTQVLDRRQQLLALQHAVVDQQASAFGVAGALAQAWLIYEEAEQEYAALVAQGDTRLEQSLAQLTGVQVSAELTSAESDRIAAVALGAAAEALTKEQARDSAQAAVAAKVVEIEDVITAALITDINADPEADASVIARRGEMPALDAALDAAELAFDAAMQEALTLWQGAVPEPIWANLVNYDQALSTLQALDDSDLTALETAFSDAETDLIDALADEDQVLRLLDQLEERAALLADRSTDLDESFAGHLLSAVRGDEAYHTSLVQGEIL